MNPKPPEKPVSPKWNWKVKLTKGNRCCCGHSRKFHGKFVDNGKNGKGSRYVCQHNNCSAWLYCDLA